MITFAFPACRRDAMASVQAKWLLVGTGRERENRSRAKDTDRGWRETIVRATGRENARRGTERER